MSHGTREILLLLHGLILKVIYVIEYIGNW